MMDAMRHQEIMELLQKNALFHHLSSQQLRELVPLVSIVVYDVQQIIMTENDPPDTLYLIRDGEVAILKKTQAGTDVCITTLKAGEIIGEMGLIDDAPRSATIQTLKKTTLLALSIADLKKHHTETSAHQQQTEDTASMTRTPSPIAHTQSLYLSLASHLASTLNHRIRQTNQLTIEALEKELEESKTRVDMGTFMINVIMVIVIYIYALNSIEKMAHTHVSTSIIGIPLIIIFGTIVLFMMKNSHFPLHFYGITLQNGRKALRESLTWSIPLILLVILLKWIAIHFIPKFHHIPLIHIAILNHNGAAAESSLSTLVAWVLLYLIFTPIQELIARGALQSSLQTFLTGPYRIGWAIVISNSLFSVTHLHISMSMALTVLVPGFFWGWLYYKQKTLLGVSVSHLIVGGLAFFVFDINAILAV